MKIISNKKIIILLVSSLFLFSNIAFAVWDGFLYDPGETNNPECLPSQTNCDVLPAVTTEVDPVFIASQAFNITGVDITKLSNLSGTNSGDNAVNSLYSGLATSKQDALNGTGFVKISGTTVSYDNSTYLTTVPTGYLQNNVGIAGGTTLIGGTGASENLTLSSTSNATKGKILFGTSAYDEVNDRLGIGNTIPTVGLELGSTTVGNNQIINATLGAELAPALTGASGVNWTFGAGYTTPLAGTIDKTAAGVNTITPTAATNIVAGTTYKVVITVSSVSVASGATYTLGGVSGTALTSATTYTDYITASTTGNLIITPTPTTTRFTISSISIKALTDDTGDLTIHGNLKIGSSIQSINNINALTIAPNGNVGIGTTSPASKLDVAGTITINDQSFLQSRGSANVYLGFSAALTTLSSQNALYLKTGNANNGVSIVANGGTVFGTGGDSSVASAKVAINSTTLGFLQPRMTTVQRDAITTPATGLEVFNITTNTSDFYNGTNWQSVLIPNSAGNVGIGTTAPNSTLDVAKSTIGFNTQIQARNTHSGSGDVAAIGFAPSISALATNWGYVGYVRGLTNGRIAIGAKNTYGATLTDEKISILDTGNVGIGTTTPTSNFQVSQSTAGTGTVATNGTITLTGTGTQFTNTFKVGNTITVSGETVRTIATITSDTSLTVTVAFSTTASALSYTLVGGNRFAVLGNGNVGIGTTAPGALLDITNNIDNSSPTLIKLSNNGTGANTGSAISFPYGGLVTGAYNGLTLGHNTTSLLIQNSIYTLNTGGAATLISGAGSGNTFTIKSPGDLLFSTYDSGSSFSDKMVVKQSGNVGIGTTAPSNQLTQKSTLALESAPLGSELLSSLNWTATDWTGDFATGFSHTTGNTTALTNNLSAVTNNLYQIAFTVTNRTAGSFTITYGGVTSVSAYSVTSVWGPKATSTGSLSITPTIDFNGTIVISIKQITGAYSATYSIQDNTGANSFEIRNSLASLSNLFIGKGSGGYNTTGSFNTANGYNSLLFNTTGYQNTANGTYSLYSNTTGYQNTASGYFSLFSNTTGLQNTANGTSALYSNTTGNYNTANGVSSLRSNTTGSQNTASGYFSLFYNTTGTFNTANGVSSLLSNTTGYSNTANGGNSLYSNTTGYQNTASGVNSLFYNTVGNFNTANGYYSLFYNTGSYNTANGFNSLYANTTGYQNTANGMYSLFSNTTGYHNTALGYDSGHFIADGITGRTTGNNGLYLGYNSKASADGTDNEIVVGYNAIGNGSNTVTLGNSSITKTILTGSIGIGTTTPTNILSLGNTAAQKFWIENTATDVVGRALTISAGSTVAGTSVSDVVGGNLILQSGLGTGTGASTISFQTGTTLTTGTTLQTMSTKMSILGNGNVGIGATPAYKLDVQNPAGVANNLFRLGSIAGVTNGFTAVSDASDVISYSFLNGNVGIGTAAPTTNKLVVVGDIRVGTSGTNGCIEQFAGTALVGSCSSDINLKTNISPISGILDNFLKLQPVTYQWRVDEFPDRHFGNELVKGLVAQEVELLFPELVDVDIRGFKTVDYGIALQMLSIEAIKELDLKIMDINNFEKENTWRDSLIAWFANAENRITRIFTGEVCLTEPGEETVCLNRTELKSLKELINKNTTSTLVIDPLLNEEGAGGGDSPIPTCLDGIKNQDETDIDIGGICTPAEEPEVPSETTPTPDDTVIPDEVIPESIPVEIPTPKPESESIPEPVISSDVI